MGALPEARRPLVGGKKKNGPPAALILGRNRKVRLSPERKVLHTGGGENQAPFRPLRKGVLFRQRQAGARAGKKSVFQRGEKTAQVNTREKNAPLQKKGTIPRRKHYARKSPPHNTKKTPEGRGQLFQTRVTPTEENRCRGPGGVQRLGGDKVWTLLARGKKKKKQKEKKKRVTFHNKKRHSPEGVGGNEGSSFRSLGAKKERDLAGKKGVDMLEKGEEKKKGGGSAFSI